MGLPHISRDLRSWSDTSDIDGLVNNVEKAAVNLSDSYKTTSSDRERWSKATECLMTEKARDNIWFNDFRLLKNRVSTALHFLIHATGLQSKAAFQGIFGQVGVLTSEDYENFDLQFPYMESLFPNNAGRPAQCPRPYLVVDAVMVLGTSSSRSSFRIQPCGLEKVS